MPSNLLTTSVAADGTVYRDLNGDGVMNPYENPGLPVAARVADLLSRMTVEEKAGQMFHPSIEAGADGSLVEKDAFVMPNSTTETIQSQHISHFNVLHLPPSAMAAEWHNRVQKVAEDSRLGIPVTISTDPRHSDVENIATSLRAGAFSTWPEALGLAALRDPDAVREFATFAAAEYRAIGIRAALHPQIDLATEPRWARQSTTFGPDAELTGAYLRAYLDGFQGSGAGGSLTSTSIACMTKHFPGGGPQLDGEDPHFPYGREQVYPGGRFEYHLEPFREAIAAGTSAIMPYYGMPVGLTRRGRAIEEVGFGFNRDIINGILREELGYDGVVCTDWQLISDVTIGGAWLPARAWGVEHLDRPARVERVLAAGCDQLGGETCTDILLDLVQDGRVSEARLDESVRRLLTVKFELGLFDDPYVDVAAAETSVGTREAVAAGLAAQTRSTVMLREAPTIDAGTAVYVEGMTASAFDGLARIVDTPEAADIAVVRLGAPFEPRDEFVLEPFFHAGTLAFSDEILEHLRSLAAAVQVIVDVTLERPAVVAPLLEIATGLVGTFVSSDRALALVLAGQATAEGLLPFDLPPSDASVLNSSPDVPNDIPDPTFSAGSGRGER